MGDVGLLEEDSCLFHLHLLAVAMAEAQPCEHRVPLSRQRLEGRYRLFVAARLAVDLSVLIDDRIGGEHRQLLMGERLPFSCD